MPSTLPLLGRALSLLLLLASAPAAATTVRIGTPLGAIDVQLSDDPTVAITVTNFLDYIQDGDYVDSFIHRSADRQGTTIPFVIQGGGFLFSGGPDDGLLDDPNDPNDFALAAVPTESPIVNQFSPTRSNVRGTIAMARGGAVNSATSQWFINLGDNSDLDAVNEGFTVFGTVIGAGMDVADAIAALPHNTPQFGSPFTELPLIDYSGSGIPVGGNLVYTDIEIVPEPATGACLALGLALLALHRRA